MSEDGCEMWHKPVMPSVVVEILRPVPGRRIIDATVGLGGHAGRLLDQGAAVLGLDRDQEALVRARHRLLRWGERVKLVHADFANLKAVAEENGYLGCDGVLMDVGLSSLQLGSPQRGFSFQEEGPLDMRMDTTAWLTAGELVNTRSEGELADLLWRLGEERYARRIARRIVRERRREPLRTTRQLARLVARCYPPGRHRIHPATRTFQALRMAVNEELPALEAGLSAAVETLKVGGRLCVISFHSLEDRMVKHAFRQWAREGRVELLTGKPERPSSEELVANPRSRSAKLRAAEVREVVRA